MSEFGQNLDKLEQRGLIRVAQLEPELEYLFKHALVQDVAYGSLLKHNRKVYHQLVGEALESLYPERAEELAATLAYHFQQGGDDPRALRYFTLAGTQALARHANAEAVIHCASALEIASRSDVDSDLLQSLFTQHGRALELSNRYGEALESYDRMEQAARERSDAQLELAALAAKATVYGTPSPYHDPKKATALMARASTLADELNDFETESRLQWNMMLIILYGDGDPVEAAEHGARSAQVAREHGLQERLAFALHDLASVEWKMARLDEAHAAQQESEELWRGLGNMPMLSDNLASAANVAMFEGRYADSASLSDKAYEVCVKIDHRWGLASARLLAARSFLECGQAGEALQKTEEAIAIGHDISYAGAVIMSAELGLIYAELGNSARGVALIQDCFQRWGEDESFISRATRPWLWTALAQCHALGGDHRAAQSALAEARKAYIGNIGPMLIESIVTLGEIRGSYAVGDHARVIEMVAAFDANLHPRQSFTLLLDARHWLAASLLDTGRLDEAEAALARLRADAQSHGAKWSSWKALALAARLAERRDDSDGAGRLRAEARALVDETARSIADASVRDLFLKSPAVTELG